MSIGQVTYFSEPETSIEIMELEGSLLSLSDISETTSLNNTHLYIYFPSEKRTRQDLGRQYMLAQLLTLSHAKEMPHLHRVVCHAPRSNGVHLLSC